MSETVDQLRAVIAKLHDRVESLEEENDRLSRELAIERGRISEIEDSTDVDSASEPQVKGDETMLPIEQLAQYGDDSNLAQVGGVTESVERAVEIFEHFREWSKKAPSGRVIRSNLRNLLSTALGERIAWRQVYRACEKLEEWSKGAIQFRKTRRHGWILVEDRSSSVTGG